MKTLLRWWHRHIWWHRFTRGTCVECGIYPSLGGATVCRVCFVKMLAQARGE